MKKFYMILVAIFALATTAQAQMWGTLEVGDWENATTYNGSYFDMAPTNFYLAHTGAQMLFTPDVLSDLNGKQNVVIRGIYFKYHNESFEDISRVVKIYMQEVDETEFAVNEDGVKQFFPIGEQVWEEEAVYELLYSYGEDAMMRFPIVAPLTPGKSLLLTMVFDAQDDDNCTMGSDYAPFYTSGIGGKAMTYTSNWTSFVDYAMGEHFPDATATLGCGTNVALPVTEIGYTYEKMRGDVNGDDQVAIADVTALIDYLLTGDPTGFYEVNAYINNDSSISIADVTWLIDMLLAEE